MGNGLGFRHRGPLAVVIEEGRKQEKSALEIKKYDLQC